MKYFLYCRKSTESEDRQVMSLESQRVELARKFGDCPDIEIVQAFEESKSAKAPGRPLFDELIRRVEAGEAQGIVAWAPDRLARNSVDGGRIIYLLDIGVLKDLKFHSFTFENHSQGKFMLNIMFGQSKYYSDALSEVVKRGNRTKREHGWRPGAAPTGYLNDKATKTIVIDPKRFGQVQELFNLVAGGCSAREATRIARTRWKLITDGVRNGGGLICESAVHHILTNPFYAGVILWEGTPYPGKHEPAVSPEVFEAVQKKLKKPVTTERWRRKVFAYTGGFIRCGVCGLGVTAETKTNRQGHQYVYYHSVRPKIGPPCKEPCIAERDLERQILEFLEAIRLPPAFEEAFLALLEKAAVDLTVSAAALIVHLRKKIADLDAQWAELMKLRLRKEVDDSDFDEQRVRIGSERLPLAEQLRETESANLGIEPAKEIISFSKQAAVCFPRADVHLKREIFQTVGSNPFLEGKKLSIQAAIPFQMLADFAGYPSGLGDLDTNSQPGRVLAREFAKACLALAADDPVRWTRLRGLNSRL